MTECSACGVKLVVGDDNLLTCPSCHAVFLRDVNGCWKTYLSAPISHRVLNFIEGFDTSENNDMPKEPHND